MSYANMDGVPTQTAGTSEILASDWNTYVRDNFDSIKFGHVVCTSTTRPTGVAEGTMIYESDTNLIYLYNGSSFTQNNLTPVGMLAPFAAVAAPDGWLVCNGAAISRSSYAALFSVIGTSYGVGDGSTTFNVPDLRGRVVAGIDFNNTDNNRLFTTNNNAAILGSVIGDRRLATHSHADTINFVDTGHVHGLNMHNSGYSGGASSNAYFGAGGSPTHPDFGGGGGGPVTSKSANLSKSGGVTDNTDGGTQGNVQPTMMLNYIIKF